MKNSNDTSWDRTSDLPICSTAPFNSPVYVDIRSFDSERQINAQSDYY